MTENWDGHTYSFDLSPEWRVEIPEASLREFDCYPFGPLNIDSRASKILLLKAALHAEEARGEN